MKVIQNPDKEYATSMPTERYVICRYCIMHSFILFMHIDYQIDASGYAEDTEESDD